MRRISDRRVLRLIRMWLDAGVIEEGREIAMLSGVPQGGVISPLLSNIYLAFLDERWTKQCADLGTLVRYADDFVIMCDTRAKVDEAERRVKLIFQRLKLKLHPEKTRKVEIAGGKAGSTSSDVTCASGCRGRSGLPRRSDATSCSAGPRPRA
jgi:RNA-directed DNA polymerase